MEVMRYRSKFTSEFIFLIQVKQENRFSSPKVATQVEAAVSEHKKFEPKLRLIIEKIKKMSDLDKEKEIFN